jgi:uncharacterized repeat protein (TIGR03803 family)
MLLVCALPLQAQATTATVNTLSVGTQSTGVLQAGDGNFYSPSPPLFEACKNNPAQICAYIYQINESGTATAFHSFQPEPTSAGPTAPNLDGIWPKALIVGTDGNLYGACERGGPGGGGTIFKITLSGEFSLIKSFGYSGVYAGPGVNPLSLMQGIDGNFYFTNGIGIFQLTPAGVLSTVYTFP